MCKSLVSHKMSLQVISRIYSCWRVNWNKMTGHNTVFDIKSHLNVAEVVWVLCSVGANSHSSLCVCNRTAWKVSVEPKTDSAQQYFSTVVPIVPHRLKPFPRVWVEGPNRTAMFHMWNEEKCYFSREHWIQLDVAPVSGSFLRSRHLCLCRGNNDSAEAWTCLLRVLFSAGTTGPALSCFH